MGHERAIPSDHEASLVVVVGGAQSVRSNASRSFVAPVRPYRLNAAVEARIVRPRVGMGFSLEPVVSPQSEAVVDWTNSSTLSLVAHLAERHHDAQSLELERLRDRFAELYSVSTPSVLSALRIHVTHLAEAFQAHLRTTAVLFPHVVALEADARVVVLSPSDVARLVQRLRREHQRLITTLVSVRGVLTEHVPPNTKASLTRAVEGALAAVERATLEHARLECDVLVPRVLSMDPSVARDAEPVTLLIHHREIVTIAEHREVRSVFCPAERRSLSPDWCSGCPLVRRVTETSVRCTPPAIQPSHGAYDLRRIGDDLCVGEALGAHDVSVAADMPARGVVDALREHGDSVAVVVDTTGHFAGTIDRELAELAPEEQLSSELVQDGLCIDESAPLADAIALMVRTHRRSLPVLGADGRVVGLLVDIDVLHRITDSKRR